MPFPAQKVWCICVPLSPREWVSFILDVDGSCICFALGKEPKLEFTPTFLGDGVMSQLLRPKPSVLAAGELLDLLHRATWFSSKWQWSNLCLLFSAVWPANVGPTPAVPMSVLTSLAAIFFTFCLWADFGLHALGLFGPELNYLRVIPCSPACLLYNDNFGSSPSFSPQLHHACNKTFLFGD